MKKIMILTTLAALAAGTAFAQEGDDRGSSNDRDWNRDSGGQHNSWNQRDERNDRQGWNQDRRGWDQNRRGDEQRPGGPVDPALMQQMRDLNKAIRTLGESARAETNETAKAELVTQLKAKLGEVANLIQSGQEKRIAQAEERLASLKAKIEDSKKNRDSLIDEQVQRILSGEKPQRHGGYPGFPNAKGGHPEGGSEYGEMPPPAGDEMAPPPAEGSEVPPPPAEEGAPAEAAPAPAE